jgi:outer membrane lipase/esterase
MKKPTLLLSFGLLAASLHAQNRTFTSQYSFGDSLSDSGNVYAVSRGTQPPAPYYNGRFSNGRVFTELLGNPIIPALASTTAQRGNLNFAYGGATAGAGGAVPNLALQITQYRQQGLPAGRNDLFTVLAGANDLIGVLGAPTTPGNPAVLDTAGAGVAQTVAAGVQTLAGLGAKNLVVVGLPNLGSTPRSLAAGGVGGTGSILGARASTAFNNELRAQLATIANGVPDANVLYVDAQGVLDRMVKDAKTLGFTNTTSYYLAPAAQGGGAGDPNGYIFWDDIHPTAHAHALVAAVITEQLNPEPVLGFGSVTGAAALALRGVAQGAWDARAAQLAATGRGEAYVKFTYGEGDRVAAGLRPGFAYDARGMVAGAEVAAGAGLVVGAAFDASRLNAKVRGDAGSLAVDDNSGRVYAAWRSGRAALVVDGAYGVLGFRDILRSTALGGLQARAKTSGTHWGAGIKAQWNHDIGGLSARPWLGWRTERVKVAAFGETDMPGLAMDFDAQQARSGAGAAGIDLANRFKVVARDARLDFRVAWHGELGNGTRTVSGKLVNNFTRRTSVAVEDGDGQGVEVGGALTIAVARNWSASAGYAGDLRSGDKVASRFSLSLQTGF